MHNIYLVRWNPTLVPIFPHYHNNRISLYNAHIFPIPMNESYTMNAQIDDKIVEKSIGCDCDDKIVPDEWCFLEGYLVTINGNHIL